MVSVFKLVKRQQAFIHYGDGYTQIYINQNHRNCYSNRSRYRFSEKLDYITNVENFIAATCYSATFTVKQQTVLI